MENIQLTLFGKTSPEHSVPIKGKILGEFSKKSQKPKFQCLMVESGKKAEWLNYQTVQSLGELLMLNIGASPKDVRESTLSQILEVNAPQKYYLSPKACQGILRRAEKRGKELPPLLKAALEAQAKGKFLVTSNTELRSDLIPDIIKSEIFVKGARPHAVGFCPNNSSTAAGLSEENEKSPTMSVTKNVAVCYPINTQIVTRSNKLGEGTGMGIAEDGEPAYTLQETHSHGVIYAIDRAAFNQGENAKYDFQIDDSGVNSTIVARGPSAVCHNISQANDIGNYSFIWIVRRLTPLECERLQGFPDYWTMYDTNENELKDTPRYKALGNSIAIPCALRVFKGILDVTERRAHKYA